MIRLAAGVLSTVLVAGCGPASNGSAANPSSAVTVVSSAPSVSTPANPAKKTCTVPDVVGKIHQEAQDTMQAAGLYMLLEEDATGQGRLLINDRNWRTTAQSVAAGSVVDCTTTIKLFAKKLTD